MSDTDAVIKLRYYKCRSVTDMFTTEELELSANEWQFFDFSFAWVVEECQWRFESETHADIFVTGIQTYRDNWGYTMCQPTPFPTALPTRSPTPGLGLPGLAITPHMQDPGWNAFYRSNNKDISECKVFCMGSTQCLWFTWHPADSTCQFYSNSGVQPQYDPDYHFFQKVLTLPFIVHEYMTPDPSTSAEPYWSSDDLIDNPVGSIDLDDCKAHCTRDERCKAFVLFEQGSRRGSCSLYDQFTENVQNGKSTIYQKAGMLA